MSWRETLLETYSRHLKRCSRVLDLGTGFSENLSLLFSVLETRATVFSVDPDEGALREAGRLFGGYVSDGRLRLLRARAESLPFPSRFFDAATAIHTFHHIGDRAAAFRELLRVVRPGGVVVILDWTPLGGSHIHPRELLERSMEETLRLAGRLLRVVERRLESEYYLVTASVPGV